MMGIKRILLLPLLGLAFTVLLACQLDYVTARSNATPSATRGPIRTPTSSTRSVPTLPVVAPVIPTLAPQPTQPQPPQTIMATATDSLRIRSAPSTSGTILGRLNQGDSAQVVGRTAASDWLQILLPSNPSQKGWVSAEFASVSGPLDGVPVAGSGGSPGVPPPAATLPPPRPGTYPYP